jgi:hypothetical protein
MKHNTSLFCSQELWPLFHWSSEQFSLPYDSAPLSRRQFLSQCLQLSRRHQKSQPFHETRTSEKKEMCDTPTRDAVAELRLSHFRDVTFLLVYGSETWTREVDTNISNFIVSFTLDDVYLQRHSYRHVTCRSSVHFRAEITIAWSLKRRAQNLKLFRQ